MQRNRSAHRSYAGNLQHWEEKGLASVKRGCPDVPVHAGIPIVFISIHGVVTQFVNVSFLCVPVHEDTTKMTVAGLA